MRAQHKAAFKIEKGIPISRPAGTTGIAKTMRGMNIGDSFIAPIGVRSYAFKVAKRHKFEVTTRQVDGATVRIWRTS